MKKDYISEYLDQTTESLEESKNSLTGNFGRDGGIPEARVAAIDSILNNRKSEAIKEVQEEIQKVEQEDIRYAGKYLVKYKSSQRRDISFELSFQEYKRLMKRKKCWYTGVILNNIENDPHSFTIDRINPNIGYTKENSIPCALVINAVKNQLFEDGNASLFLGKDMFLKFAEKIKNVDIGS